MLKLTKPLFSTIVKQLIFAFIILYTTLALVGTASALDGTYIHVKDSDGTVPKKDAVVTITFKGGNSGTLSMSAVQPNETVTDTGKFFVSGDRITIEFKEMEWAAERQPCYTEGCYLILPFKALGWSTGPGASLWSKNSADCKDKESPAKDSPIISQLQAIAGSLNNQQQTDMSGQKVDNTVPPGMTEIPTEGPAKKKESCIDCQYGRCIKELIAQKQAFIEMYKNVAKEYADLYLAADKKGKLSPARTVDKKGFMPALPQLMDNIDKYQKRVQELSEGVMAKNPVPACHMLTGEISTKTITCEMAYDEIEKFAASVPCRQISEIANEHESYHLARCQERTKKDKLPTPYGLSMEEVETHQLEINKLTKLLADIKKTPKGCWRCGKTQVVYLNATDCAINCPVVKLGGNLVFQCFKLNEKGKHIMGYGNQF